MARHSTVRTGLAAAASVAALALLVTGCRAAGDDGPTHAASPGITDSSITLGISSAMSGSTAGVGNCSIDGARAYFGQHNAEGGIAFGDGKTRTVKIMSYDDAYDPQKALSNFQQMVADDVFADVLSLGTPTNLAVREAAIADEVPQVLVNSGDPIFSDQQQSPWQLGLTPTYPEEGKAFGEYLVSTGEPHKVAILFQNDDFGTGYVDGFMDAIAGHDQIQVVKKLSYEATDQDVNAQITALKPSHADVFFNAMSTIAPLVMGSLRQADAIGWHPSIFLPSVAASPDSLLKPSGVADEFPAIYTTGVTLSADSDEFQSSEDGKKFLDALHEYTKQNGTPTFPQCVWSWVGASILEQAFTKMEEPTREAFMTALRSISGFHAPFLLGTQGIDTTKDEAPALSDLVLVRYDGSGLSPVG